MGPEPTMATVPPCCTFPLRTPHSRPVGRISLSMTKAFSSSPSGIWCKLESAFGILTYSACVPSTVLPSIQPPVVQCEVMPLRQYSHVPHAEMQDTSTRSPCSKLLTPSPI